MDKAFPLCYETLGSPHNPCIILIPGIGGQLIDWPPELTQGFVDNGFYVVIFDNRDSGLSHHYDEFGVPNFNEIIAAVQKGKSLNPPYTLEDVAGDVINLMDILHINQAHIVGISMGGMIAQYVALNFYDRVISLTCIATTSSDPKLPPAKREVLEYFSSVLNRGPQSVESFIQNKLQLLKIYNHPDYFDEEKTRSQLIISFNRAYYPAGFKRLLLATICAASRTERLRNLSIPCLIVHGDYDPVFPVEHGVQLAKSIADSYLVIIEKMGHGLPNFVCEEVVHLMTKHFR